MPLTKKQLVEIQSDSPKNYAHYMEYQMPLAFKAHSACMLANQAQNLVSTKVTKFVMVSAYSLANSSGNYELATKIAEKGTAQLKNLADIDVAKSNIAGAMKNLSFDPYSGELGNLNDRTENFADAVADWKTSDQVFYTAVYQALIGAGGESIENFEISDKFFFKNYCKAAIAASVAVNNKQLEKWIDLVSVPILALIQKTNELRDSSHLDAANFEAAHISSKAGKNIGPEDAEYQALVLAALLRRDKAAQERKVQMELEEDLAAMLAKDEKGAQAAGVDKDRELEERIAATQDEAQDEHLGHEEVPLHGPAEMDEAPVDGGVTVVADSPVMM